LGSSNHNGRQKWGRGVRERNEECLEKRGSHFLLLFTLEGKMAAPFAFTVAEENNNA
jgi:hypothetical protein